MTPLAPLGPPVAHTHPTVAALSLPPSLLPQGLCTGCPLTGSASPPLPTGVALGPPSGPCARVGEPSPGSTSSIETLTACAPPSERPEHVGGAGSQV